MSLRIRLALATTAFVLVGLVVAGGATYGMLQSFLLQRIDQQLLVARRPILLALNFANRLPPPTGRTVNLVPGGTVGEIIGSRGTVLAGPVSLSSGRPGLLPALPTGLGSTRGQRVITADGAGGSPVRFRVLAQPVYPQGVLVVAIPLTEVTQILQRLLLTEIVVTLAVVLGLGGLSWWAVRRELRPLERIGETAAAIAVGDLSQRVEQQNPTTEVGRLGVALNAMLTQIERAFEERRASENRMRRFLADASHELRTPLTSIRGYAELFRRGARARPTDLATSMRRIEQEAERMGVVVDDLLLLARLGEGRPLEQEPVDLVAVAIDAAADAQVLAPGRSVTVDAPPSLVVTGDEARLRQVVANLLANALVHTPDGTAVAVRVGEEGDATAILEVADLGPGVPAKALPHLFEPFYRADPARTRAGGGTGLGLSIVAAIVEAHGGAVAVASTPGEGARFRVRLPRVPAAPPVAGAADPRPPR
ncbi:MAG TPA: ATP-binding protein [Candidatus Dormibacteraeota bacterium]|nr:ATP-binding protein [Candidatus Dormibacteraeota bacterium]